MNVGHVSIDSASAYESHAHEFLAIRDRSDVGIEIAERWARSLDVGTDVIEIACGGGIPITRALINQGLNLWAVDSSQTLVAEFRIRFPNTPVQCARIQECNYFGRKFGAVVAIGLIFLLSEEDQLELIRRVSKVLIPGARFLFTAPAEIHTWTDLTTGHECRSLGRERYEAALQKSGFRSIGQYADEGKNNHFDAEWFAEPLAHDMA